MRKLVLRSLLSAAVGLAGLAGLGGSALAGEPLVLQTAMKDVVKPQTNLVLNVLIEAVTEPPDVHVDPTKLADSDWEVMETAAKALRDELVALRDAKAIRVTAAPGDKLYEEELAGMKTAADVQGFIDADPAGFREHAEEARVVADRWLAAIHARDAEATWAVALQIDPACAECHEIFWSGEPEHEHGGEHAAPP